MIFWGFRFLAFLFLATVQIEMPGEAPDTGVVFSTIITRTSMRLQEVAGKRPHKLKGMNDSISETARAALLMASRGEREEILAHLEKAREHYPSNSFTWLLQAVVENAAGEQATAEYETFLRESRTYTDFERSFLSWDDFHTLRRIVYELLRSRGVSFEGREKQIQVRIPFRALMEYVQHPSPEDKFLNIAFIAILFGGALGLFAGLMMGAEYGVPPLRSILVMYAAVWVAYGFWLGDLAFGLPEGWNRFRIIPWFLGLVFLSLVVQETRRILNLRSRPLEDGYQRCSRCGEVFEKLVIECPRCRKQIMRGS